MFAPPKPMVLVLPALVLAACARHEPPPATAVSAAPPPVLTGALGAPLAPDATASRTGDRVATAPLAGGPIGPSAATAPTPLSGSSTPPGPVAMPGAPMRMSANDITAALSNNTAEGVTTNGDPYAMYFASTGEARFRQGSFSDAGRWQVFPDGKFCSSLNQVSRGNHECYFMYRSGNGIIFQRPDGVTVGNLVLFDGNPEKL